MRFATAFMPCKLVMTHITRRITQATTVTANATATESGVSDLLIRLLNRSRDEGEDADGFHSGIVAGME